ncbi:transcriptional coactivator/pterin dehydratase [Elsinoe ampelina]|uniref:4a-hydroxytetrahydrobiopterin dehydratase n=1 Tax=Elsinoe ampelina TaxID=302913 RepID=A0A6A6GG22_9PEZI|nr:transcriptional coactivator/pterin dehydratase [Elsinoe ampelina]
MASASTPLDTGISISAGYDEDEVKQAAADLTSSESREARRWHVTSDGKGLERVIRFKTFKATWDFMNSVAGACKEAKHHPEWTNIYNKTHIIWTTHSPPGLSTKDTSLARFCDEAATKHGELEPTPEQQKEDEMLFRSKKMEAPDCCTPKT